MNIVTRKITPAEAQKLLQSNTGNRRLNQKWVQFYYQQMVAGQWMLTGDTIKIDSKEKLKDGQHRLAALVKFGKPLDFSIAEGVSPEVFSVLDTGKTRSAGDIVGIKGYKNAQKLAASSRYILLFKNGYYTNDSNSGKKASATNSEVLKFIEENESIQEICEHTNTIFRKFRFMPHSTLTMLYWFFSKKDQTRVDIFFDKYATGIELSESSPIRLLRERLLKDSSNKTKLKGRDKVALFIFAWNAFRQSKRMQMLTLQKNYKFPKPI